MYSRKLVKKILSSITNSHECWDWLLTLKTSVNLVFTVQQIIDWIILKLITVLQERLKRRLRDSH